VDRIGYQRADISGGSWAGVLAHSTSLLADALDKLGDALVYGFSLFVLARSARWQAGAALAKGGFMLAFGTGRPRGSPLQSVPSCDTGRRDDGGHRGIALAANLVCFFLRYRHRDDNLNMSSTWLCSTNDLIANVGVLLAAGGSYLLVLRWPDIIVGGMIASLFLSSALSDAGGRRLSAGEAVRERAERDFAGIAAGSLASARLTSVLWTVRRVK
jgi:hypothetical protein